MKLCLHSRQTAGKGGGKAWTAPRKQADTSSAVRISQNPSVEHRHWKVLNSMWNRISPIMSDQFSREQALCGACFLLQVLLGLGLFSWQNRGTEVRSPYRSIQKTHVFQIDQAGFTGKPALDSVFKGNRFQDSFGNRFTEVLSWLLIYHSGKQRN